MTSHKPLIVWEKWIDPFGNDIDETLWTDYNNDTEMGVLMDSQEPDEETRERPLIKNISKSIKVIASPLGLIPYNEHTASSKIFNFWIGHSNFNISEFIKNTIENIDGVEILDIFTRYRFRIAVGKCFNDSETMKLINDKVYEALENQHESELSKRYS